MDFKLTLLSAATLLAVITTDAQLIYRTSYGPTIERSGPLYGMSITYDVGNIGCSDSRKKDLRSENLPDFASVTEVSFRNSDTDLNKGSDIAYLHIYDDFATGTDQLPMRIGNLIGVSMNTINLGIVLPDKFMKWYFKDVKLQKGKEYHYILAIDKNPATIEHYSNLTTSAFRLNVGNPYSGGRAWKSQSSSALKSDNWDMEFDIAWEPATKEKSKTDETDQNGTEQNKATSNKPFILISGLGLLLLLLTTVKVKKA